MKLSVITSTMCVAALAVAVSAQSTPAPTTAKPTTPAPTTVKPTTPAPTTAKPATPAPTTAKPTTPAPTTATPAASTVKPVATPASTTAKPVYDGAKGCWHVSVERDATYCIAGPICSGSGAQPAGWNCPKKGDVAVERCLKYLKSYVDVNKCVAPVDAECKVIHTGAWGCVLKGDTSAVTPAPTKPTAPTPAPTKPTAPTPAPTKPTAPTPKPTSSGNSTLPVNGTTGGNSTKPGNGTTQAPKKISLNAAAAGGTASSVGTIAAVAGVAAVVCATVGAMLYKKSAKKAEENDELEVVDVVTP